MARSNNGISGTIDLTSNLSPEKVVELTGKVHQLPCCIKFNGPSDVSQYFKPKSTDVVVDGLSVEEAHFRGRKLQGTTVVVPHGYSGTVRAAAEWKGDGTVGSIVPLQGGSGGFVLGKKMPVEKRKRSEEDSSCWEMKAKFQNITLWNHDSLPSENDASLRAFHLFSVATALHQPVSLEDLEAASIDQELEL
ncbi:hypothetical protein H5410_004728 [Solanum commersonii]|uniref:Uncharacterized protein n=1 Tax=Solanum commersonii TaxID=4109 RepID=A0A9J6A4E5_SOLCO|nr:hypothetical protein H5410_004728 [Solanum commersonii]